MRRISTHTHTHKADSPRWFLRRCFISRNGCVSGRKRKHMSQHATPSTAVMKHGSAYGKRTNSDTSANDGCRRSAGLLKKPPTAGAAIAPATRGRNRIHYSSQDTQVIPANQRQAGYEATGERE